MLSALARDQQQQIPVRNPYPESADIIQLQHGASAHGIRPCSNLSTSRGAFGDIGIAVAIMLLLLLLPQPAGSIRRTCQRTAAVK